MDLPSLKNKTFDVISFQSKKGMSIEMKNKSWVLDNPNDYKLYKFKFIPRKKSSFKSTRERIHRQKKIGNEKYVFVVCLSEENWRNIMIRNVVVRKEEAKFKTDLLWKVNNHPYSWRRETT